jgi:hypothetical protein
MKMFIKKVPALERHRRETLENISTAKGQYYSIAMQGHRSGSPIDDLVMKSFVRALAADSKLPAYVRDIDGMSGQIYRSFINNLVGDHPDPRYFEIGCWAGSTATAALYGNKAKCLCVDNWSLFGGPKEKFFENIERIRSSNIDFKFLERDFRSIDYSAIGLFNIYMFDGPHATIDQYDGVKLAQPALEETYILIVDDWNWSVVRDGTLQALIDTKSSVQSSIEVRTNFEDSSLAPDYSKKSDWHNGYFIATVKKS